ncbi:MAG TPA: ATP-binding protein, partial [Nocardioidaceae bacterium]
MGRIMGRIGGAAATPAGRRAAFAAVFVSLVVAYAVITSIQWSNRSWSESGPLSFHNPAASTMLHRSARAKSIDDIARLCRKTGDVYSTDDLKVVGATLHGTDYYACYELEDGQVYEAVVIDADGARAPTSVVKEGGAWRWIGLIKTPGEILLGGVGLGMLGGLYFLYYRRDRPAAPRDPRWWQTRGAQVLFSLPVLVQPISLVFRRRESGPRRLRLFLEWLIGTLLFFTFVVMLDGNQDDLSITVTVFLALGVAAGWGLGRLLVAPRQFGRIPDGEAVAPTAAVSYAPAAVPPPAGAAGAYRRQDVAPPVTVRPSQSPQGARTSPWAAKVRRPSSLPTFRDVGGMTSLKEEMDDTLGLLLAFSGEAERYRIAFNGLLLHGDPGVGKSFLAQATAGEFGLSFLPVSSGDLISKYVGESA